MNRGRNSLPSRRDWFRLRLPNQDRWLGVSTPEDDNRPAGLQVLELPPNHDGMDLEDLPPLREALLTAEQVASLFDDIEACASDICLFQRRNQDTETNATKLDLVREPFLRHDVKKLQIRYQWRGSRWIDTLEQKGSLTRLVRISHK